MNIALLEKRFRYILPSNGPYVLVIKMTVSVGVILRYRLVFRVVYSNMGR